MKAGNGKRETGNGSGRSSWFGDRGLGIDERTEKREQGTGNESLPAHNGKLSTANAPSHIRHTSHLTPLSMTSIARSCSNRHLPTVNR
jgi:hypothetical protein